jgi:hypothetical protein
MPTRPQRMEESTNAMNALENLSSFTLEVFSGTIRMVILLLGKALTFTLVKMSRNFYNLLKYLPFLNAIICC